MIDHTLYRALQQTAVKEVTRPLPSLAERVWPKWRLPTFLIQMKLVVISYVQAMVIVNS